MFYAPVPVISESRKSLACVLAGLIFCAMPALSQSADQNQSLLRDAASAIAAGDALRAETDLQTVLRAAPDNYQALDLLGMLRAQQRREAEAEGIFEQIIAKHPEFAGAHIHLGLLYIQMGQPDSAVAALQEGIRLAPDRVDAISALVSIWREQARTAISSGNTEEALSLLLKARKLSPENADVQFEFGMTALKMNLLPDAITAFQQSLKLRPDDANATYGLGRAYMEHSQYEDARQQFSRYLEARPNDASGHYALGMAYASLERPQDARTEFEKSIALAPVQTESYFRLGVLDLNAHDLDAAATNFQHVLDRDPKHAGALAALGRVKYDQKHYPESAQLLERAVASDHSLREAHYYLGLTYARLGRKEDSEQQFQIATRLEHEELEKQKADLRIVNPNSSQAQPK